MDINVIEFMPVLFSILSFFLLGFTQLLSYSSGPQTVFTDNHLSTSCHSGSAINTTSMVSISGLPRNYQPNTSYLTLSLTGLNVWVWIPTCSQKRISNVGSLSTSQSGVRWITVIWNTQQELILQSP